jgi:hypothetical protein
VGDAADELVVELEERELELCEFKIVVEEAVGVDVGVWDPEVDLEDALEGDALDAMVEDDGEIAVELEGMPLGEM